MWLMPCAGPLVTGSVRLLSDPASRVASHSAEGCRTPWPYDRAMARTQTMVQLTSNLVERLDGEAARRGVSRSALIREAIERLLDNESQQAAVGRYVAGYRAIPQGMADTWGDLGRDADTAGRMVAARLDAEEARAGLAW